MDKKLFSGASTALITPFNDDGSINYNGGTNWAQVRKKYGIEVWKGDNEDA